MYLELQYLTELFHFHTYFDMTSLSTLGMSRYNIQYRYQSDIGQHHWIGHRRGENI